MSMRNQILPTTLAAGTLLLVSAFGAYGQLQSSTQQACLSSLNKDGAAVAKEQGKENVACLKNAGKGTLVGTAQACLTADAKGKVATKKAKTTADESKSCGAAPGFGYTSAATVNTVAQQAEVDLMADVFGASLDAAVLSCTTLKTSCLCQQKVSKTIEQLASVKLAEFVKCKKATLKAGATSTAALSACVNSAGTLGSIAADTKGKIAKTLAGLNAGITKSCDTPGVTAGAFLGTCNALTGGALGTCLDVQVECRVCQAINEMDDLFVNCDVFDDGLTNTSCISGTGPSPTPTPTPTLTPTPTATPICSPGPVFQGSLTSTVGRFNYNLQLGLPGANSACNSNFAGSHACTYFELQCAQAAGSLVGATDTSATLVTSFWAIDPSASPFTQCVDDAALGSNKNWEYGTAHTISRGQRVALDNLLGTLGPLQTGVTGVQCNFSGNSAVGCCQ